MQDKKTNHQHPFHQFIQTLSIGQHDYHYYPIISIAKHIFNADIKQLPLSLKILFENALRHGDASSATEIIAWLKHQTNNKEIAFRPARILLQDFTGVPAIADLAAMRDAMKNLHHDPSVINPTIPVDLVIDHSVMVNEFGKSDSLAHNMAIEFEQNLERYEFLKWGQNSFNNLRIVPPGLGICHQINIEYLAKVIFAKDDFLYPDSLVGTDSHTTMVNGLGIIGFGVGGIEAEAAMLGQPIPMVLPEVIGFKLHGQLPIATTATDLVLTATEMLRKKNVVNKFVEFYGEGVKGLSLETRATLANMAPEYGATIGLFPIDQETIRYLRATNRSPEHLSRIKHYAKTNGMWHDATTSNPIFSDELTLDLSSVEPSLAGPKRPQDRVPLHQVKSVSLSLSDNQPHHTPQHLPHHAVVIAAITSCTNTSNPFVMVAAGLLAKKAVHIGLTTKPWVKTSLAPGSRVVMDYLKNADLLKPLETLGFGIVGFGCTTCIGNSGPLKNKTIEDDIKQNDLIVSAVLSGNRNFEGRIHPLVKANWLASPPLVVVYALLGSTAKDPTSDMLGQDKNGKAIFLKDIWPSNHDIQNTIDEFITPAIYKQRYENIFHGTNEWQNIASDNTPAFKWRPASTYIKKPPFFDLPPPKKITDITACKVLAFLGDSITTDHISPAGSIKPESPAGDYLKQHQVAEKNFNSFGARRGNHEVMMRGTLASIRLKNDLVEKVGGFTLYDNQPTTMFDAAMQYKKTNQPLLIIAGHEYGTGSSRDWAAKGVKLLGVKAVVALSFERIHRSNLIGMGVLPLEFIDEANYKNLSLDGKEYFDILGLDNLSPQKKLTLVLHQNQQTQNIMVKARIDNESELHYFKQGGVLPFMLGQMAA
ncbi:MAG: aconitate hydratase AcnA [Alphaproteobacteria bacterium]